MNDHRQRRERQGKEQRWDEEGHILSSSSNHLDSRVESLAACLLWITSSQMMMNRKRTTRTEYAVGHSAPSSLARHLRMPSRRLAEVMKNINGAVVARSVPRLCQINHAQTMPPIIKSTPLGTQPTWRGLNQPRFSILLPWANKKIANSTSKHLNAPIAEKASRDFFLTITGPLSSESVRAGTSRARRRISRAV